MRKLLFIFLLLTSILLTSCQTASTEPKKLPTEEPTQEPTQAPTPEPTVAPTEVVNYCFECHIDKEQLIATGKPVEVVESESSGVG